MTPRGLFNILVTWILAGLWHGADWRYVIFGLVMVPGLLLQMQWRMSPWRRRIPIPAVVGNIMTMWWICMALILYRAESMSDAGDILMSYVFFLGPETAHGCWVTGSCGSCWGCSPSTGSATRAGSRDGGDASALGLHHRLCRGHVLGADPRACHCRKLRVLPVLNPPPMIPA